MKTALIIVFSVLVAFHCARAQNASDHPGPSFQCPVPRDPLAQLICAHPQLAEADLTFVQVYEAYRQQLSPAGQKALRQESIDFGLSVRANCGIGNAQASANGPLPPAAPPEAVGCVQNAYEQQRALWASHLTGAAQEEAKRPISEHIGLQRDLQTIGLLPINDTIDGVFGPDTRVAIQSFQQTMNLPVTGLLGTQDALALERQALGHLPTATPPSAPAPVVHGLWENYRSESLTVGVLPSFSQGASGCQVALDVRDPDALAKATSDFLQDADSSATTTQAERMFKGALLLLRTKVAAGAVHAFYGDHPDADHCTFLATAHTQDLYGRDIAQPLFTFTFDRATFEKIAWPRFDPKNLPKIMTAFEYGSFAQTQFRAFGSPAPASPAQPAEPVVPQAPVRSASTAPAASAPFRAITVEDFLLDRDRYASADPPTVIVTGQMQNCADGQTCSLSGNGHSILVDIRQLERDQRKQLLETCSDHDHCNVIVTGQVTASGSPEMQLAGVIMQ